MKITKKQLIKLIKENLIKESTSKNYKSSLSKLYDTLKKHNIEIIAGEQSLQGSHVIFIEDLTKCRSFIKELKGRLRETKVKAGGPCNRYFVTNGLPEKTKRAYKKATGSDLEIITTFTIDGYGGETKTYLSDKKDISPYDLFHKNGEYYDIMPMGTNIITKSGEKFEGTFWNDTQSHTRNYKLYGYGVFSSGYCHVLFTGFAENICGVNFNNLDKVDLSKYIKPKYIKKTKPQGPSVEYTQSTTSKPFIEDRPGPSRDIRPTMPPQYATNTGRSGQWMTEDELIKNDLDKNNFPSKALLQKGGVNYYWVDDQDFELEKSINPEYDLD